MEAIPSVVACKHPQVQLWRIEQSYMRKVLEDLRILGGANLWVSPVTSGQEVGSMNASLWKTANGGNISLQVVNQLALEEDWELRLQVGANHHRNVVRMECVVRIPLHQQTRTGELYRLVPQRSKWRLVGDMPADILTVEPLAHTADSFPVVVVNNDQLFVRIVLLDKALDRHWQEYSGVVA